MNFRRPSRSSLTALAWVLGLLASPAWARQDAVPGSRYTSARAAALGDAYLPLGDDGPAALFYNPAVAGKIRGTRSEPVNFSMHANGGFVDTLGLDSYKAFSLSSNLPHLQQNPGTLQGMGFSLLPSFATKGFAFGVLLQNQIAATSDAEGNVRYKSLYQLVPAASVGVKLAGGIVRLGYGIQWVNEAVGDISVPAGSGSLGYSESLSQGSGLSHTLGFALTLPVRYLPSLNLVARNAFNTRYGAVSLLPVASNSPGAPATEQMTVDGSLSLQPKIESGIYSNLVLQYRDMTGRSGMALLGRLSAGAELSLKDALFLRGGFGSGYPSAGIGFRMSKGEFSMSWYSEELGTSYHELRDIRYMLHFQMRAF